MKQLIMNNRFKMLSLNDQWWVALAAGVSLLLVGSAVISWSQPSISPLRWILQAAPVIIYILFILQRNLRFNRRCQDGRMSVSLGAANWITLARGGLIAMLAGFWWQPWPGRLYPAEGAGWLPGILFIAATLGDALDGWVARMTDNQTLLGIYLDTRIDALGILVASFVAVSYGQLPEFYISAGLAWYLLRLAVWLRKKTGRRCGEVKRRRGARLMAGLQMAFLGLVLLPLFSPPLTHVAAVLILIPFLAGFFLDWHMVCHHENSN
ncbi:MAG: CDP-alcohol phosphatidyltransferase family protein [Deltaproteobacteria bacterium]|jgi:CDP-diacylglycerol--glycerol-3-phosphate 3-phosphatidyltransferase|nr:CDP-alcohol phosphatidyltransferase family protein [Deltaproteobacteria bacterium]